MGESRNVLLFEIVGDIFLEFLSTFCGDSRLIFFRFISGREYSKKIRENLRSQENIRKK